VRSWDRDPLADQEAVIGRRKGSGAPLTGSREFDEPDLARQRPDGEPVIPVDAHIRHAAPSSNAAQAILRRSYACTDGTTGAPGCST
jgi:deferrochelatase/peroxidase EfeB